ncbi:MAG: oligopeptide/dipeptide ABC transporter ATP-binding protein, partial [Pyramidobacter sp.]|nr:oligopeptide/dipeptide ABC transporter ATP-binding protein [Pyramidobacter sp.]
QALLAAIPEPDIEMRNKKIQIIRGEVTSPVNPPSGCRFASRCEHAADVCREQTPLLTEYEPGHWTACHFCGKKEG